MAKTDQSEQGVMEQENQQPVPASFESVGDTLRKAREKTGQSLRDVAGVLRIRYVYLEAIEQGDFASLPGDTYAYGFIRTYSEHLELDQSEIVRRFKEEVENYGNRKELVFPQPVSEGKIPGFAVFFAAALCLILAYGGWVAVQGRFDPVDLVETTWLQVFDGDGAVSEEANNGDVASGENDVVQAPVVNLQEPEAIQADVIPPVEEELVEEETQTLPEEEDIVVSELAETLPPAPAEENVSQGADVVVESTEPADEDDVISSDALNGVVSEDQEQTVTVETPEPVEPQRLGAEVSQVVLRARFDTWIQIQNAEEEILFGRVLRAGDSYGVPGTGSVMKVGNAGGLTIEIDGVEQPALGEQGRVVSDIPLDPQTLRNFISERQDG
ncbi:helix-turn-helix domain-containing protein [Kiloniella sp. b19]|uniref:helix-turn-helix domain-containing protein n=1 Tax=Kiloniella sp. GXU_MW_B19 TaxID=3141326 RepID=UPI0031D1AB46